MTTKTKLPKCPKGWRRLNRRDVVRDGDKVWQYNEGPWRAVQMLVGSDQTECAYPLIRRKSTRKGEK